MDLKARFITLLRAVWKIKDTNQSHLILLRVAGYCKQLRIVVEAKTRDGGDKVTDRLEGFWSAIGRRRQAIWTVDVDEAGISSGRKDKSG
jgi:hypothetical protein